MTCCVVLTGIHVVISRWSQEYSKELVTWAPELWNHRIMFTVEDERCHSSRIATAMSRPKRPFSAAVMILAVSEKLLFSPMNKRHCPECTVKRPENVETARSVFFGSLLEIVSTENLFLCGRFKHQSCAAYALFRCLMCMMPEIVYLHRHVFSPSTKRTTWKSEREYVCLLILHSPSFSTRVLCWMCTYVYKHWSTEQHQQGLRFWWHRSVGIRD
jgi:hypothetical protein